MMKQFHLIKTGDLSALLSEARRDRFHEQNYVELDDFAKHVPILKTKDEKYIALELKRYDQATRYLSKAIDSGNKWAVYELHG